MTDTEQAAYDAAEKQIKELEDEVEYWRDMAYQMMQIVYRVSGKLKESDAMTKVKDGETMITEEIFGVRLKMLLQERGLSQKAFARMMGVCTASMCKWIKGSQYPHFKQLIKMADVLDISLDELCGR